MNTMKKQHHKDEDEEWVAAALSDDTLVADLLSRLNHSSSSQRPNPHPFLPLPSGWGHRQPRSKPKKDSSTTLITTTRCSPTTPLSWSGGSEEGDYSNSSRPSSSDLSRSNNKADVTTSSIYSSNNTNNKRSSKKKTKKKKSFSQLKEEENLLLKERVTLKRKVASLHVTLNQERLRSENLKRIKIDLNLHTASDTSTTTACRMEVAFPSISNPQMLDLDAYASTTIDHHHHHHHTHSTHFPTPHHHHAFVRSTTGSYCKQFQMHNNSSFALPDLNMMPSEEDVVTGLEMVNGMMS